MQLNLDLSWIAWIKNIPPQSRRSTWCICLHETHLNGKHQPVIANHVIETKDRPSLRDKGGGYNNANKKLRRLLWNRHSSAKKMLSAWWVQFDVDNPPGYSMDLNSPDYL